MTDETLRNGERRGSRANVADAIGACFRGAREGDARVRSRVRGWFAFLTGGGFAVYAAMRLLSLTEEGVRRGWVQAESQQQALVTALEKQTTSIDNLVWTMWETQANGTNEHGAIMRKLGVLAPPRVARPPPQPPSRPYDPLKVNP